MLEFILQATDLWDEANSTFIIVPKTVLQLEHSLSAISKWESFYKKPFLGEHDKTPEETKYYTKCMTIGDVDPNVYHLVDNNMMTRINQYVADKQTATFFSKNDKSTSNKIVTSEEIYYWMVALTIPFECDKWNFSRLMTLIDVCSEKNKKPKKMSAKEIYDRNVGLNEARKKALKTNG